ncbi:hypothetical protein [Kordia sp.]|uniref:ExbD/TolR family protein n=1 Tax=Kordia sp. TaxID=1965332 RepID=UPI0025C2B982|nr:hypothetical protein [Kordia sp.]MCH2195506.1 hypothetical protein [Kordia sp.]
MMKQLLCILTVMISTQVFSQIKTDEGQFQIIVKGNNTVTVNNTIVSLDELKGQIKQHYLKNTANSYVSLKIDSETLMGTVVDIRKTIQEVLELLWNGVAMKKFKRSYDELTESQQQKIHQIYPRKYKIKT